MKIESKIISRFFINFESDLIFSKEIYPNEKNA